VDPAEARVREWLDLDDDARAAAEAILTRMGAVPQAWRGDIMARFRQAAAAAAAVADAVDGQGRGPRTGG
jgi:hypothetical protein